MSNSFYDAFRHGFENVVIIGSDIPDIPSQHIDKAFQHLHTCDVVIGPAVDGGYYLLGFRHDTFSPNVFKGISWSTSKVFDQTLEKIRRSALTYSTLPEWHDIDNLSELQQWYNQHQQTKQKLTKTISYLHKIKGVSL